MEKNLKLSPKQILAVVSIFAVTITGAVTKELVKSKLPVSDSSSVEKVLIETSKQINATLPMQIDKETRMDTTLAGPGNRVTYAITLINASSADIDPAQFTKEMRPRLINGYKTNPKMAMFREKQVEMHYMYRDKDANTVANIVVSPKDF